jgi:signal transduction histidine kinase
VRQPVTIRRSLRRLRWQLTTLYTVTAGMGLVALAVLAVNTDSHLRETRLGTTMDGRARTAVALLYYADGVLRLDGIKADEVSTGSPQLLVLLGAPPQRVAFASARPPLPIKPERLRAVAAEAVYEGRLVHADGHDDRHRPTVLTAVPLYDDAGQPGGAVVIAGDPEVGQREHDALVAALVLGCVALVVVAGITGHLLSGRTMRPAADALERQEAFLADAAHDLRTPVATIRALAESRSPTPISARTCCRAPSGRPRGWATRSTTC